ncbi:OmpA family protein [Ichthyenterobacterium magnum]|uniref:Outer membrane protein OmpA-like peptidoglycan-associated protein n=1 Tax=Ichthyenterobacterium magnum TaxID=1230530 RepID=A0A420DX14_9FLAO|nr:OmpA family protein [Ichthyenterobacterium magnum]RKE98731.1 outer membrane protein OmpA-like peptidoglycan-associated protein [Ichthyenterobacterium magnum]
MKNLSRLFFAMLLLVSFNANAQDENNPWGISIGVNAVDLYPVGEDAPLGDYLDEFFNLSDHYNILPSLSTVSVSRYLQDGFTLTVAGSINEIDKVGDSSADDLSYYALDGTIKYSLTKLINSNSFDPYIGVGGGYTWVDDIGAGTLNGTLGFNYWFTENVGFNVQTAYKHAFEDYLAKHWQHSVGLTIKFGGKDTDGDGIYDKDDACPDVPGLEAFNGCPDSDNDGIEDSKDDCPNEAGLAEFNGCPDADGDGVADKNDDCPTVAGLKALAGCPDADGDGVADKNDDCPNEKGPAANKGCPWADADGDGVLDKDDKCPNEVGTVANNGCPEVLPTVAVMEKLNNYARTILFDSGKSSFKKETQPVLEAMTAIFKEYPRADFSLEGHTDSQGAKSSNQLLSERRANAVRDYLIANGISADRLTASGFGEDYPIDNNKTAAGRKNNRRVEVKLKK